MYQQDRLLLGESRVYNLGLKSLHATSDKV